MNEGTDLIAISVGNTRTQIGRFADGELEQTKRFDNGALSTVVETIAGWCAASDTPRDTVLVLASVNDQVADPLVSALEDQFSREVYRIGEDLPIPLTVDLDPETITGVDRLLNAAACFGKLRQACVVVDAGTAITVDFIDGHGTFHGGAIAPGARLQLKAMHDYTAALPDLELKPPQPEAFGKSTAQAMLHGVYHGVRGMVQRLVEQYAERYGAFPMVIATGGDAEILFRDEELVDRIIPDLTLIGIAMAVQHALAGDDESDAGE